MEATIEGRIYEIEKTNVSDTTPNLRALLVSKGWDGDIYEGVSKATGRHRKEFRQMFFRRERTGEFESVV